LNTFSDFIAAARHLVAQNYTSHDRIVAQGGSAGGMLMGAVANMAPEAFGGIIAEVPFVDVLNTMLDDFSSPPPEWPEWGTRSPRGRLPDDPRLLPYDNVACAYPAISPWRLTDPAHLLGAGERVAKPARMPPATRPPPHQHGRRPRRRGPLDRLQETAFAMAFALKVAGRT
jgi:oligopeptidase B